MANEIPDDDARTPNGDPGSAKPARGAREEVEPAEGLPRFPEHVRQAILESEARMLASWKKRGLFGLTTSTG